MAQKFKLWVLVNRLSTPIVHSCVLLASYTSVGALRICETFEERECFVRVLFLPFLRGGQVDHPLGLPLPLPL